MLRYREHVIGSCCYLNTVDGKAIEPRSRIMMVNLHKMRLRKYNFFKNDNTKEFPFLHTEKPRAVDWCTIQF